MTVNTINQVQREMVRVFGAAEVRPEPRDDSKVRVTVKGWPDWAVYRVVGLIDTLRRYEDGHGATEDGDREVCQAIEEAGAFVCLD